jgi:hypothetical protein
VEGKKKLSRRKSEFNHDGSMKPGASRVKEAEPRYETQE